MSFEYEPVYFGLLVNAVSVVAFAVCIYTIRRLKRENREQRNKIQSLVDKWRRNRNEIRQLARHSTEKCFVYKDACQLMSGDEILYKGKFYVVDCVVPVRFNNVKVFLKDVDVNMLILSNDDRVYLRELVK